MVQVFSAAEDAAAAEMAVSWLRGNPYLIVAAAAADNDDGMNE